MREAALRALTFGETMGLCTSTEYGLFEHAPYTRISFGGAETNVAIGMRRLGVEVTWVSRLGTDSLGRLILRELRAEGVDARVRLEATRTTGFMLKERVSASRTSVTYYRQGSAASSLSEQDLPLGEIADFDLLHVTGITAAIAPSPRAALLAAVAAARAAGVLVSLDLNYRASLWSRDEAAAFYRAILPSVDVAFAGDDEARILHPEVSEPLSLARQLVKDGAGHAVIKLGSLGAVAHVAGVDYRRPAEPATVIDTVGAGDSFVAGYLAELLRGASVEQRLETATRAGAATCETLGDWEGAPTVGDLARDRRDPIER